MAHVRTPYIMDPLPSTNTSFCGPLRSTSVSANDVGGRLEVLQAKGYNGLRRVQRVAHQGPKINVSVEGQDFLLELFQGHLVLSISLLLTNVQYK